MMVKKDICTDQLKKKKGKLKPIVNKETKERLPKKQK